MFKGSQVKQFWFLFNCWLLTFFDAFSFALWKFFHSSRCRVDFIPLTETGVKTTRCSTLVSWCLKKTHRVISTPAVMIDVKPLHLRLIVPSFLTAHVV